jgi:hypothetical protein
MSVLEKFFPKGTTTSQGHEPAAALQLLFTSPLQLDAGKLQSSLRAYDPQLATAVCELDAELSARGTPIGVIYWREHTVRLIGFDAPMPSSAVESCLQPAHFGPELKAQSRAHKAHVLLNYVGDSKGPLDQYVAVAAVAAAMHNHGALVVLNEGSHTAFPAAALAQVKGSRLALLETMPLLMLYCGFVKFDIEGTPGTWMRTYGNPVFKLPDLALLAKGHEEGQATFDMFCNVMNYLRNSGATFDAGHTMQLGEDRYLKVRAPVKEEYWLDGPGPVLVLEIISKAQINKPPRA